MNRLIDKALGSAKLAEAARSLEQGRSRACLGGVWGSAGALAAAAVGRLSGRPVLYVAGHLDAADDVADDLEVFTGGRVQQLPAWELDLGVDHVNDEIGAERLRVCNLLAGTPARQDESANLIVAPVMALLQPVPSSETLAGARLTLVGGLDIGPDGLADWLVEGGYEPVEQVDQQGDFARRGGIVDVFPPGTSLAIRVDFFGDEIDSIRRVDLDTQRSTERIDSFDLTAVAVASGAGDGKAVSFLEYLPDDAIVCMHEPDDVWELAEEISHRVAEMQAIDNRSTGVELLAPHELSGALEKFRRLEMLTFAGRDVSDESNLGVRSLQKISLNTNEALKELADLSGEAEVRIYCENPAERDRFGEVLRKNHPTLAERAVLDIGHVHTGFYWPDVQAVAVGHHEIFHRYAKVRRMRRVRAGRPIESLLDLVDGDYVVHISHGIAKFEGLRPIERDGRTEEYLRLRFADNAVLHVPSSQIGLVQRYIGSKHKRPALSKLGGKTWSRQKARVAEAVEDMAAEMLRIQAMRHASPGTSYPVDSDWQRQFADEFLYTETEDQLASIDQIDADLAQPSPMDRLLCGDVGFGKTELAMRAAFKVVEAGRQVAVLVPTTVLAEQHWRTFRERFADYPCQIEMISRYRTKGQQADICRRLKAGQVDVLIGTHRLLSADVEFADLGLVVIDEEQRFGVEHKEHFKSLRATVDVLTLTATPIPRTMHMALLGLRDISSLSTPPMDRRAIHTEVRPNDDGFVKQALLRELSRGGQVYFVHNRVVDIASLAEHIQSLVPDARVAFGHGQMSARELEKVMLAFVRGELDVLVCTTIIESGLDIPSANTMIIHDADRFGLSQLHQLRGRVGRYKHRAYCYLLLPDSRPVNPVASRRLKAIEEFSDLGAGFQIAMRDLEIRGAGNILGREQSGHIATVGYELYCELLEQAVARLRGEEPPSRAEVHIELGIDAYIPASYIPPERQRMETYRRLVRCTTPEDIKQLQDDLADAYGPIPTQVETLLDLAEIRVLARRVGVESIIRMDPDIIFSVSDFSRARHIWEDAPGTARLPDSETVHWRLPKAYHEMPTMVIVMLKRFREAVGAL
ncbi:MAG: transcription-repair coupling factor [Planctomycetota bacterium]